MTDDKDIMKLKKTKDQANYRIEPDLLEDFKSYCKLTKINQTNIIEKAIKDTIKDKAVQRKELNIDIPVYATPENNLLEEFNRVSDTSEFENDERKRIDEIFKFRQNEIVGYVKFNNYLDVWNGETYCYETKTNEHKGISILETPMAFFPVSIRIKLPKNETNKNFQIMVDLNRDKVITSIISFGEAIDEIEKSKNNKIYEKFPELEKYKKDPLNYTNTKNDSIAKCNTHSFTLQIIIDELLKQNKEYVKELAEYDKLFNSLENEKN